LGRLHGKLDVVTYFILRAVVFVVVLKCEASLMCISAFSIVIDYTNTVIDYTNTAFQKQSAFVFR
jgi:hypothetical protein